MLVFYQTAVLFLIFLSALRKYRGRVSFVPAEKYIPSRAKSAIMRRTRSEVGDTSGVESTGYRRVASMPGPEFGVTSGDDASSASIDEAAEAIEALDVTSDVQNAPNEASASAVSSDETGPPATPLLPPIDQPIPSDGGWVTVGSEFVTVLAVYLSHLGPDLIIDRDIRLADDAITIVMVRHNVTRVRLLRMFSDMSEGKAPLQGDGIEVVRVKAFRFEPQTEKGYIAVDGELVEYGPIQGQLLPGLATVMGGEKLV